MAKAIV